MPTPSVQTPEFRNQLAQSILDRHSRPGVAEAEIRAAVRDFLIATDLAPEPEIEMEQSPASGSTGRVDLRTRDVIFEFKTRIGNRLTPNPQYAQQLDAYLAAALAGEQPQRFGILTDGKYWMLRWPAPASARPSPETFQLTDAQHGQQLYEWLRDRSQALEARGVPPTEDEVRARFGQGPRFDQHIEALTELYQAHRDDPTVALKRDLWRALLAAALGQVVEQDIDLDRLFVRHTYLSLVVGLAVQQAFGIQIEQEAQRDPAALCSGDKFLDQTGVSGVVESDFFTWPAEAKPAQAGGAAWIRDLAKRISWINWQRAESDIVRILYESVIPADDRKQLGEYYTPDWLARQIVDTVATDPLNQRLLDPACGSGSFIFAAVRKYLTAARDAGRSWSQSVDGLLTHVIGIDVHPVAVHLARATWMLAAREALAGAVEERQQVKVTVPVYLGDSLQLRAATSGMFDRQTVTIPVPDSPDDERERNRTLEFPRALVEQADWFDNLMTRMATYIEQGSNPVWALDDERIGEGEDRKTLERTAESLKKLHDQGRNHIWAYYTRNLVRPVALQTDPVDVIVGNPPWLTYNKTQAVVREELERLSKGRYKIWDGGRYATHQDIAGMFFARVVELYLKPGGVAAMLLPHSALQTGQYKKWRDGQWGDVAVDLGTRPPWDLERIEPNTFFKVPACVVFLRRKQPLSPDAAPTEAAATALPRQATRWRGPLGGPFSYETVGLTDTSGEFASPYGDRFRQGATIVPRALFFVNLEQSTALVQAANTLTVSPRRTSQEKRPWKDLALSELAGQAIEAEHVVDVHLGETVAPYVLLEPLKAVLPLSKTSGQLEKSEDGWYGIDPLSLGERMRKRWRTINEIWDEHKSSNNRLSLVERIDYMRNLSTQRRTTDDGRRTTDDGRRTTDDGRRTTDDGRRTTDDGRRTTDDGTILYQIHDLHAIHSRAFRTVHRVRSPDGGDIHATDSPRREHPVLDAGHDDAGSVLPHGDHQQRRPLAGADSASAQKLGRKLQARAEAHLETADSRIQSPRPDSSGVGAGGARSDTGGNRPLAGSQGGAGAQAQVDVVASDAVADQPVVGPVPRGTASGGLGDADTGGGLVRVVYASAGRPTAAIVAQPNQIIESKLFWITVASMDEADYLSAIINSQELESQVAPLMSKGQFGARDLQKHLWHLPIPEYDASDALHVEIAEAGATAAAGAQQVWSEIRAARQAKGQSTSFTVARREIRAWLSKSDEGRRVEDLVGRLL